LFPARFGGLLIIRSGDYRWRSIGPISSGTTWHFASCEEFTCNDDNEAVAKAKRLVGRHDVEVWSGERFIVRLTPEDPLLPDP
jgi:hypothetical protein